jgi:hypothetical protein
MSSTPQPLRNPEAVDGCAGGFRVAALGFVA